MHDFFRRLKIATKIRTHNAGANTVLSVDEPANFVEQKQWRMLGIDNLQQPQLQRMWARARLPKSYISYETLSPPHQNSNHIKPSFSETIVPPPCYMPLGCHARSARTALEDLVDCWSNHLEDGIKMRWSRVFQSTRNSTKSTTHPLEFRETCGKIDRTRNTSYTIH